MSDKDRWQARQGSRPAAAGSGSLRGGRATQTALSTARAFKAAPVDAHRAPWSVSDPTGPAARRPRTLSRMAAGGASLCCLLFAVYANAAIDDLGVPADTLVWQGLLAAAAGAIGGTALWLLLRLLQQTIRLLQRAARAVGVSAQACPSYMQPAQRLARERRDGGYKG